MDATLVFLFTIILFVCVFAILNSSSMPVSNAKIASVDSSDTLIKLLGIEGDAKYQFGLLAAFIAGVSFSMSQSLSKFEIMTTES